MYFVKTPNIIKQIYPSLIWEIKEEGKNIYLTFDDGPDEAVTSDVLDLLENYEAKATFFCVGEKVVQNPTIYQEIIDRGHSVGNHSHNHLKGKQTSLKAYLQNVEKASKVIKSNLFRPPYGSFRRHQVNALKNEYSIVMWSVLPGDFDKKVPKQKVLKRAIQHTKAGSIIVFHDNKKFKDTMIYSLTGFLEVFKAEGFNFKSLTVDLF
jgi:peptidoglycan/xylan/chitin deacetylase (PgdA/CDA1 family)